MQMIDPLVTNIVNTSNHLSQLNPVSQQQIALIEADLLSLEQDLAEVRRLLRPIKKQVFSLPKKSA
jgi:hypothetical protein